MWTKFNYRYRIISQINQYILERASYILEVSFTIVYLNYIKIS